MCKRRLSLHDKIWIHVINCFHGGFGKSSSCLKVHGNQYLHITLQSSLKMARKRPFNFFGGKIITSKMLQDKLIDQKAANLPTLSTFCNERLFSNFEVKLSFFQVQERKEII